MIFRHSFDRKFGRVHGRQIVKLTPTPHHRPHRPNPAPSCPAASAPAHHHQTHRPTPSTPPAAQPTPCQPSQQTPTPQHPDQKPAPTPTCSREPAPPPTPTAPAATPHHPTPAPHCPPTPPARQQPHPPPAERPIPPPRPTQLHRNHSSGQRPQQRPPQKGNNTKQIPNNPLDNYVYNARNGIQ